MDFHSGALIALVIFATHFVGGVAAYGSTLLALPLVIGMVGEVRGPVFALLIVATLQSLYIVAHTFRAIAWGNLARMVAIAGVGIPIGVLSAARLPQKPLLIALGTLGILGGLSRLWAHPGAHRTLKSKPLLNGLLLVGGIAHGAFACGGTTLALYGQQVFTAKEVFRSTLSCLWSILGLALITSHAIRGGWSHQVGTLILVGVPSGMIASWLGQRTARYFEAAAFVKLVSGLLIISGLMTCASVLLGL